MPGLLHFAAIQGSVGEWTRHQVSRQQNQNQPWGTHSYTVLKWVISGTVLIAFDSERDMKGMGHGPGPQPTNWSTNRATPFSAISTAASGKLSWKGFPMQACCKCSWQVCISSLMLTKHDRQAWFVWSCADRHASKMTGWVGSILQLGTQPAGRTRIPAGASLFETPRGILIYQSQSLRKTSRSQFVAASRAPIHPGIIPSCWVFLRRNGTRSCQRWVPSLRKPTAQGNGAQWCHGDDSDNAAMDPSM